MLFFFFCIYIQPSPQDLDKTISLVVSLITHLSDCCPPSNYSCGQIDYFLPTGTFEFPQHPHLNLKALISLVAP